MSCCRWPRLLVSIYAVHHAGWDNIVAKVSSTMGSAGFDPIENPKFGITFSDMAGAALVFHPHLLADHRHARVLDQELPRFQSG